MILISQNITNYDIPIPENSVFRINLAWINTLEELKKLKVGQGHVWNDVKVFKANDFKVVTGPDYEGLFDMLSAERFDYFSRGINEAPKEYDERKARLPNLFIEESILLYYPWPKYFFTSNNSFGLVKIIQSSSIISKSNNLHILIKSFLSIYLIINFFELLLKQIQDDPDPKTIYYLL